MDDDDFEPEFIESDDDDDGIGESTWETGNDMNDFPPGTIIA